MANGNSETAGIFIGRSILGILFTVVFLDNLGFAIVVPYLFFYVVALGGSPFLYGVLLASYSLMSFVFTPTVARLSDRFGRRKILLIGLAVSGISYVIFGAGQAIWVLFAGRTLAGTTAATVPVAQAYIADVTIPAKRLRYLGLLGAAAGVAFIFGPAIGGTLSDLFGYGLPSFLAASLAFTNLVLAYFRLPEPSSFNIKRTVIPLAALLKIFRERRIVLLLSTYFMFFVAFVFMQAALSPWLQVVFGFGSFQVGLVFFFIGGFSVVTQAVLLPVFSKKFSQLHLTLVSIGVFALGLLVLGWVQNLAFLFAVAALTAFGFGIQYVMFNTLISLSTSDDAQGGTLGIAWAIAGLAQTIAPILAASVFSFGVSLGFDGLVFVASAAISVATVPLVLGFKKASE